MKKIKYTGITIVLLFLLHCAATIDVEYPVFPNTKDGRSLQRFVGARRNVALIVEKQDPGYWGRLFGETSFVHAIPEKVFASLSEEGYYNLIDASKREELLKEQVFSEAGLTAKSIQIGNLLGSEMLLFVKFNNPVTECVIEGVVDKTACAAASAGAALSYLSDRSSGYERASNTREASSACSEQPTAVRLVKVPITATLINAETGETRKASVLGNEATGKSFSSAGSQSCPSAIEAFDGALDTAVGNIKKRISPAVRTAKIRVIRKSENKEVAELLEEGYQEITGETPNFERASKVWKEALSIDPNSEGANANLASYYWASGDYESAIEYFEKAMKAKEADKPYWREKRKEVEAVQRSMNGE